MTTVIYDRGERRTVTDESRSVRRQTARWPWALSAALVGVTISMATAQPVSQPPTTPTLATLIDASVDRRVGCISGGNLYFLVGAHRVHVDPLRWRLRVRLPDEYVARTPPVQACKSTPLKVHRLDLFGPTDRELMSRQGLTLADGTLSELRHIRDDFLPIESSCRRGPHWTWCGTAVGMSITNPDNSGTDPYVSLKFDPDFYRTPTGQPYFVSSRGDAPLHLKEWAVVYRWDGTLVLGYRNKPCTRPPKGQKPVCTPLNYIDVDRDVQQLVRSVLDDAPSPSSPAKPSLEPQHSTR